MGFFDLFKKKKVVLEVQKPKLREINVEFDVEQFKEDRMWDLWAKGKAESPYAEIMTYQSEISNGGHDQYFFNVSNTGDLNKEMSVLREVLPEILKSNLEKAYAAYLVLEENEDDEESEDILNECDRFFYDNEGELCDLYEEYIAKIEY